MASVAVQNLTLSSMANHIKHLRSMDKTYQRAIELLNARKRGRRPSTSPGDDFPGLNPPPSLNGQSDVRGTPSILGMKQWLDELGHSSNDLNKLNLIHVAGTKGKGSTCAFIVSLLNAHGRRSGFPRKVGLYTSPHLLHPEERIRINMEPLSRDLLAKYFFEIHDVLFKHDQDHSDMRPRYLQLWTLLAFHTFIREGVDAAIFETHHGGEYDSTNVIDKPVVTAITTLGLDHIKQLGPSIENVAWHKAGIFKRGSSAVSAPQVNSATEVLKNRAFEKQVNLQVDNPDDLALPADITQLKPDIQRTNCSVAVAVVRSFLDQMKDNNHSPLTASDILQGASQFSWPGRFQLVIDGKYQWFLDSAHNDMSVTLAAEWFIETSKMQRLMSPVARILIFSMITSQRDALSVFKLLSSSLVGSGIQYAIFTTYDQVRVSGIDDDPHSESLIAASRTQQVYAEIWKKTHPDTKIFLEPTIRGALRIARNIGEDRGTVQTLVTGSQHLVGGVLSLLQIPARLRE